MGKLHGFPPIASKPPHIGPKGGVGGEKRPERPVQGGGPHPQGRNEVEDSGAQPELRHAVTGLGGRAANPACRPEKKTIARSRAMTTDSLSTLPIAATFDPSDARARYGGNPSTKGTLPLQALHRQRWRHVRSRYPTPGSVIISFGAAGSSSIF